MIVKKLFEEPVGDYYIAGNKSAVTLQRMTSAYASV